MTRFMTTTAAALALALTATAGSAQEATTFDIDRDAEGRAAFENFNASFDGTGIYDAWDADADGMLSRDEFNRGVFGYYDADDDDYLNDEEILGMGEDRLFADETVKAGGAATTTQD